MTRARTSPLADDLRRALADGSADAADLAHGRRHPLARPGRVERLTPPVVVGHPLTGDDALELALTPASPLDRARLRVLELHGAMSMVGDPFEDPAVTDADVQTLLTQIALDWDDAKKTRG